MGATEHRSIATTGVSRSVAVVGFAGTQSLSPRGERTNMLTTELARIASVELITGTPRAPSGEHARSLKHRVGSVLARTILLDVHELESARRLRSWRPSVDAALLIGFPFSPLSWAARRLARADVPYIVDIGDPWVLTADRAWSSGPALMRARRCERFIWEHAAGGILTTELQAEALTEHFPGLPILVQPNGFTSVASVPTSPTRPARDRSELRIVHYGNLYGPRLDVARFLQSVAACGPWRSIRLTLYGSDWKGSLAHLGSTVAVDIREPRPWHQIVVSSGEHDVALVVGNHNPGLLPSKAVQYLTLPMPRVALVSGNPLDALEAYVSDKPGWLTLRATAHPADEAVRLAAHIARSWSSAELQAPESESWAAVTARMLAFIVDCTALAVSEMAA
jgi:hypothetical protein